MVIDSSILVRHFFGVDILQEVMEGPIGCGVIAWDSKNRKASRNDYIDKLKSD